MKGNKEDYWLNYRRDGEQGWKEFDSTTGALYYTYHRLTKRDMDFYESLLPAQKIQFKGLPQITICHGSPERVNEKMLPGNTRTLELIEQDESRLILCGHTHIREKIEHNGKVVLNPGCAGNLVPLQWKGAISHIAWHRKWME